MKTHLLGNQHQWIIESHYEDKEEFDFHWDKKVFPSETREDVSDQTSTYRGKQFNIHPDAYVNEWKFKPHLQEQIDKVGLPIQITDLCALWIIEYKKGGWQKAHRHSDPNVKKLSAVVYLTDADPDPTTFHGGTFAYLYDGEGNTHDLCYKPNRGDLLIFKSTVLHGSYPVRESKKVFVVDYFYEDKYV
tara:strand:- start:1810 stop:2376 length:567 start_codon:yes stop_codon:yes gene_type:complete